MKSGNLKTILVSFTLVLLIVVMYFVGLINIPNYLNGDELDNYNEISEYVNENILDLEQIVLDKINNNEFKNLNEIKSVNVYENDDNVIVQFETGGKGLVPSSTYYGFYYSKINIPVSFDNSNFELEQINDDKWKWQDVGDNYGITIRIRENWFYFEASF